MKCPCCGAIIIVAEKHFNSIDASFFDGEDDATWCVCLNCGYLLRLRRDRSLHVPTREQLIDVLRRDEALKRCPDLTLRARARAKLPVVTCREVRLAILARVRLKRAPLPSLDFISLYSDR